MTPPAIILGYRRPRHQKQLSGGSPTASTDCGPRSTIVALEGASEGKVVVTFGEGAAWVKALRRPMTHFDFWPATSLVNHAEAIRSDFTDGALMAVDRPTATLAVGTVTHATAINWLERGAWLIVGIDYGAVNDLMPRLSGSPTFRGGHFVTMGGYALAHGVAWTYLFDPLHDGRRAGIPKGVQTVRVARYLRAAETFGGAGAGHAKVGVVKQ